MTKDELLALIETKVAQQGNQGASELAEILKEVVEQSGGSTSQVRRVDVSDWVDDGEQPYKAMTQSEVIAGAKWEDGTSLTTEEFYDLFVNPQNYIMTIKSIHTALHGAPILYAITNYDAEVSELTSTKLMWVRSVDVNDETYVKTLTYATLLYEPEYLNFRFYL